MAAAAIEPRPKARDLRARIEYYTIIREGTDHGIYATQEAAIEAAKASGYSGVHVAQVRHNIEQGNPSHFWAM